MVWGEAEVVDVTIGKKTADDGGAGWSINGLALCADGDGAVVADADTGLLAPDVAPPRAGGSGTDDGSFFGEGLLLGGVGSLAEFAVDFVLVGVGQEWVEQMVGSDQFDDVVGGQERDETFLPVVMATFDFAFGLWGGSVEEFDAVEVKGRAELSEGIWVVSIEEGVVVHVKCQGQAVGLEDTGKEVEVSEQGFTWVEACSGVEAGGVVLPERAVVAGLPAFDGFANGFVAGVGVELMSDGPTADTGAVGFEAEAAVEFAGDGAVGGGWF